MEVEEMMIAIVAAIGTGQANVSCARFAAAADRAVLFQIERIPIAQIASEASPIPKEHPWSEQQYQVGRLIYHEPGTLYRSEDDRFPAIRDAVFDQTMEVCGFRVGLPSGYDAATGRYLRTGQITPTLRPADDTPFQGSRKAGRTGAEPVLAGYVPVASDSTYSAGEKLLLTLMKPKEQRSPASTLIVASRLAPSPMPAVVLAELRGDYRAITIFPSIHSVELTIGVFGMEGNNALKEISFKLTARAQTELAAQLN